MKSSSKSIKIEDLLNESFFTTNNIIYTDSLNKWISNIIPLLPELNKDELIKSLFLFTKTKFYDYEFIQKWISSATLKIKDFSPSGLSKILYYTAKTKHMDNSFTELLVKALYSELSLLSAKNLSHIIGALSKLEYRDKHFLQLWVQNAVNKMGTFNNKDLVESICSVARLDFYDQEFLENWLQINKSNNFEYEQQALVNSLYYLTMIYINNPDKDLEQLFEYILAKANSIDCSSIYLIEEKRQILAITSAIDGFSNRLVNFSQDIKNKWLNEISKESIITTSFSQRKIAAFIAHPPIEFEVEEEKFSSITASHLDVEAKYKKYIFAIQDDGLIHYYSNDRKLINYQNFADFSVNARTKFNTALLEKYGIIVSRINSLEVFNGAYKSKLSSLLTPYKLIKNPVEENNFSIQTVQSEIETINTKKTHKLSKKNQKKNKVSNTKIRDINDQDFEEAMKEATLHNEAYLKSQPNVLEPRENVYKKLKTSYKNIPKEQRLLAAAIYKKNIEHIKVILVNDNSNDYSSELDSELSFILDAIGRTPNKDIPVIYEICKLLLLKRAQLGIYLNSKLQEKAFIKYPIILRSNEVEICAMIVDHFPCQTLIKKALLDNGLIVAVNFQLLDMVNMLLAKGANVNFKYLEDAGSMTKSYHIHGARFEYSSGKAITSGMSALHNAVILNWAEGVKLLLQYHANPNIVNSNGDTPLSLAFWYNQEIASLIIKYSPNINFSVNYVGREFPILHYIVLMNHNKILKEILETKKINLNIQDREIKITPLTAAIMVKKIESVKLLIEVGNANINLVDIYGYSALTVAIKSEEILIDSGVKQDLDLLLSSELQINSDVKKYLGHIVSLKESRSAQLEIIQYFISKNADLTIVDNQGYTLLMHAIASNDLEVIQSLIKSGIDPNLKTSIGNALTFAATFGKVKSVSYLLEIPKIRDKINDSPFALICAASYGHIEVIKILLQAGADINVIENESGHSALISAVESDKISVSAKIAIVEELIEKGADLNIQDKHGFTALDKANIYDCDQLENLLMSKGAVHSSKYEEYKKENNKAIFFNKASIPYIDQGKPIIAIIGIIEAYKILAQIIVPHKYKQNLLEYKACLIVSKIAEEYKEKLIEPGEEYKRVASEIKNGNIPIPYKSVVTVVDLVVDNYLEHKLSIDVNIQLMKESVLSELNKLYNKHLLQMNAQDFIMDSGDISLEQNLLTLKSDQAVFVGGPALPEISTDLIRIANYENRVGSNPQLETKNLIHEETQSYVPEFAKQLDLNWQIQKLLHLTDLWKFESLKEKYGITASFDAFRESNSNFRQSVLLKLHPDKNPDKQDCKDDFVFATNLREDLNKPFDVQKFINEKIQTIQPFIYKVNIGFKVFDTSVDTARLIYIPTADNAKKVLIDTTYLYSMYCGINGISIIINGADIAYKAYEGEYEQALAQGLTTAGYMLVPAAMSFVAIPYVGFAYGAAMAVYTGYSAIENAYAFYNKYNSEGFKLNSTIACKDLAEFLANSPLQQFYDFALKAKEYAKASYKIKLEEKGEFGKKLYEYIYAQLLEENYELLNKVSYGILSEDNAKKLKAKHIKVLNYDHCMEVVELKEEQSDHYYCYNQEQQILDHVLIGRSGEYVEVIERL